MARGGVFCVEGQWHRNLDEEGSVQPTLDLLERLRRIRYIHKDVATPDELEYFLGRWALRQYADYHVGFFAMHGEPGKLWLTDRHSVDLADVAEPLAGRCEGRRLYFGSCSVMRFSDSELREFLMTTGAAMVCGYTRSVDWVEAAAFETVLLDVLATAPGTTVRSSVLVPRAGPRSRRVSASGSRMRAETWRPRPQASAQAA